MNYRVLLVAAVAAVFGFAAQAVEWSGSQVVTANVDDDVELLDQVEVTVASGSTFAINGKISGSGSIKLVGGGTLQLAVSNDFSGGAYIDTGVLQVLTGGALGTGDITVKGSTKATSQLWFGPLDEGVSGNVTIIFPNNIFIENSGSTSYYQLMYGPHGASGSRKYLRLTGDITCNGDLYFRIDPNSQFNNASTPTYRLDGDLTANKLYLDRPSIYGHFYGKIDVGEISAGKNGNCGIYLYNSANRIMVNRLGRQFTECKAANALGGMAWIPTYQAETGRLALNAFDQVVAYMDSSSYDTTAKKAYLPPVTSTGATLTLTGGVETATFEGRLGTTDANNVISLVVDANDGFTQTFSGTNNLLSGSIAVKKGTLVFSGADALPEVSAIEVESGAAFKMTAEVVEDENAFPDSTVFLDLGATGFVDLNGRKVTVASMTIGGADMAGKTLTNATHPNNIAAGTEITVLGAFTPEVTEDKTKNGDWIVNVPEGETVTVLAEQTGSGRIQKVGSGELILAAASTFTGGIQIDEGIVTVAKNGALGTGPINIAGSKTTDCQLRVDFVAIGEPSTIVNAITLENDSKAGCEALYFVYPTATTAQPAKKSEPWTVTFTGGITAKGTLCIRDNRGGNKGDKTDPAKDPNVYVCAGQKWIIFDCPIDATGEEIRFTSENATCGDVEFKQKVTAKLFYASGYKNYNEYGNFWFDAANEFDTVDITYCPSYLDVENALGDPNYRVNELFSANFPYIYLQGHDQRVKSIYSGTKTSDNSYGFYTASADASATPATLTIDGAAADGGKSSQLGFFGKMTLVLDAQDDDFVQTLRGSTPSGISGAIVVKKGQLIITESPTFKYLPEIVVEGGVFESQSEVANCFQALKRLTVKNGGVFRASSAVAFPSALDALSIETGAQLDIPADMALSVASLTVNGMGWRRGVYTKAQIAALPEGVTLNVTADTATEAIWTGAGADNLTTTLGNWLIGGEVPTAIDFAHWVPLVTLAGGTGMTYVDGDWFTRIDSALAVTNHEGVAVGPFTIEPATEGATLKLTEGLRSEIKRQLVLSGHFVNAAGDVTTGEIFYELASAPTGAPLIKPTHSSGSSEPLVLKDVTIDMPLRVMSHGNYTIFMGYAGTTNTVNGLTQITTYSSYIAVDADGMVDFAGGLTTGNAEYFYGPGGYRVGKSGSFADGMLIQNSAKFIFDTEEQRCKVNGNKNREGIQFGSATVCFGRDNCLTDTVQMVASGTTAVRIEFGQTSQKLGRLSFNFDEENNKSAWLNGDYSSVLELTCKIRPGAWSYPQHIKAPYCNARVTGGLSIHMNDQDGGTNVFVLAGRDFESCGDLIVSAGTMELAADATWLHGTNFTAKGEGTLKFAAADQVNSYHAVLHLADNGKIYIPEGVTLSFAEAFVREGADETAVEHGKYTGSEGALADRIIGGGTLRIGKRGMMLMIQ